MTTPVRVRFAPSPTGYLHVGGARTALFDWLFARQHQGTFILRIEDTDVQRSSEDMTQGILDAMQWLGLKWDEGPYFQSKRIEMYRAAATRLMDSGKAYRCFCSPETLEKEREAAAAQKIGWRYDRRCLALSSEEVERRLKNGDSAAVRFKVPDGAVSYRDEVFGDITIESETIEDFVLLRSDTQPTYHMSVVVDDIDMHITHVVRGADHISNTPKQILLYQALGAEQPIFAHLPLILGPDKTRMSKRHGATSVMAYKEQGILPEAFCNFLALLGWAPGDDREMFDMNELIAGFSMKGISKANAVFNPEKLSWFNAQYMQKLPTDVLIGHLRPEFQKAGIWRDSFDGQEREWLGSLLEQLRPRAKNLVEMTRQARVYILDSVEFDPVAVEKSLKDPAIRSHLSTLADRLESAADFRHETIEGVMRGLAAELGIKPGVLMGASRVALTGQTASPGIFEVISILGRDKTIARLRAVRNL